MHRVTVQDRVFILIGTAHVSQESADLVRQVIDREQPDCVCVELDAQRYKALSEQRRLDDLDLKEVIRRKQLSPLIVNVILSSYQKRLGGQLGVMPGTEMLEATKIAKDLNIPIALCDRDVRVTLGRAWRSTPWLKKFLLLSTLLTSMFDRTTISEEMLRDIRQKDVLSEMLRELGELMPTLRTVLIDERDLYLAHHIRGAVGKRLVAVLGAAHIPGVQTHLAANRPIDLEPFNTIPPVSSLWRVVGWGIPALIVAALLMIGLQKGAGVAGENILFWILANGIPSAIGAAAALAHPLTILTAFVAAPLTSLTPVIGAGYVTAFVQAYFCPPSVRELHSVSDDVRITRQWWRNRLLRIFLAFILPGIGSLIGTWIGGVEIFSNLFS
ncbi:TraB/GumN family protein [Candidatus Entotheonella palauensis]|uniref:Conjugal transfer protein TraB n=1 Tax=Candidatus Entotheonella gemina TaxID=1429439 RepID=W4MGC5_9BACT|nr:TraB/GumN family protein [Candidatus Entotheonella palauensis]ETX08981.1 MAG: conjugal transfer protein TraB [Candidatus Entotheonella gemina]